MKDYIMSDEGYDPQDKLALLLTDYINAATDLAENVKRNIKKKNVIDNETVLALNNFIIAANSIAFLEDKLTASKMKLN